METERLVRMLFPVLWTMSMAVEMEKDRKILKIFWRKNGQDLEMDWLGKGRSLCFSLFVLSNYEDGAIYCGEEWKKELWGGTNHEFCFECVKLRCILVMKSVCSRGGWMYRFGTHKKEPRAGNRNLGVLNYIDDIQSYGTIWDHSGKE